MLLDPIPPEGLRIPAEAIPLFKQWQVDKDSLRQALAGTAPTAKVDEFFEKLVNEAFTNSKGVFEGNIKAMAEMDLTPEMGKVKVPTLLIWGEQDVWVPLDGVKRVHEAIKGSRLEIINGVGHSLNVERPEKMVELLVEFAEAAGTSAAQGQGFLN